MKFKNINILAICLFILSGCDQDQKNEFTVLQWNIWQEGTMVPDGYEAIVNEIARLQPDFITLSEVRNYEDIHFNERIVASLKEKGLKYYSFFSYDSGLLSKHPITDTLTIYPENNDHGSIYKLNSIVGGCKVSIYTAHLDYLNCAYYNIRGYDGSHWEEIPPLLSVEEVLKINEASQRDDAITAFIEAAKKDIAQGYNVIIGGDFNEPSHRDWIEENKHLYDHNGMVVPWTVTTLCEQNGFIDAYRHIYPNPVTHPGFTFPSDNPLVEIDKLAWAPKADERERIDFVFYQGGNINVKKATIFGPKTSIVRGHRAEETSDDNFILPLNIWPTDHKGVFITFETR